ncbi:MAG TPA: hypothetical protein VNQ78_02170 [Paracoccus sp. (in: a-proteobacteria)]|uniref:ORC-CDC6 family AAA ATPase n=1 Tax=Paracoccus sp. TaxID=267 RepID=UPI002B7BE0BE|nr:hypothetical protein [Paracoccus sp. (in: a-proteobacteria)]HWL55464.1 hypothetical protein [Paracoccus sp. (in: a-proteobacteria)]
MCAELSSEQLMKCLIGLKGRAERLEPDQVIESFSSVGPLLPLISTEDHQVIFGRRGTGKTHALRYLYATKSDEGDCAIFVDMRNLGSDNSIYNDHNLAVTERATRLLIDTLVFIQDGILDFAVSSPNADLATLESPLDRLGEAVSQVRVSGEVKVSIKEARSDTSRKKRGLFAKFGLGGNSAGGDFTAEKQNATDYTSVKEVTGAESISIRFPELSASLRDVVNILPAKRFWIILDEWSSVPLELQPFLADMLKRAFFNIPQITVKIGAIEHRTKFLIEPNSDNIVGLEVTADIRSNVRLDDYLLFENNNDASVSFFKEFLYRHIKSYCKEKGLPEPEGADEVYRKSFNQKTSLEEFVKAAEGVPRDALHIISICAQKSLSGLIDIPTVRAAAHRHYQEDKSSQVEGNAVLRDLLQFIVDTAIRKKKTNAFLLEVGVKDHNIDLLFDRRMIHIRQRNVSSRDNPGARYVHYKIDYGCYVDLIATRQMPREQDFFGEKTMEELAEEIEVPMEDDARSYRRSILDLEEFYVANTGEHSPNPGT